MQKLKVHAYHLCPQHFNPEDIQSLPSHILRSHVNYTFHAKFGANCSSCHAVLTCASLCDDSFLAEALSQENLSVMSAPNEFVLVAPHLADSVVNFVGTSVISRVRLLSACHDECALDLQVFSFQPDLRTSSYSAQVLGKVKPRWTINITVVATKLFQKSRICHSRLMSFFQFQQAVNERFWNKLTAKLAKPRRQNCDKVTGNLFW